MVPIAIIDDGVNTRLFNLPEPSIDIKISESLKITDRTDGSVCANSHGTMCAAIIHHLAPEAELISIRITNMTKSTTPQLIRALEWCAQNGVRLINLSMGTVDYRDFSSVCKAVQKLAEIGCVLVCAFNNMNIYTCPASLPCVLGVKSDRSGRLKSGEYSFEAGPTGFAYSVQTANNIVAGSSLVLTDRFGAAHPTGKANSFAAPYMTALVYRMLSQDSELTFQGIVARLQTGSVCFPCDTVTPQITYPAFGKELTTPIIAIIEEDNSLSLSMLHLFRSEEYNPLLFTESVPEIKDDNVIPLQFYTGGGPLFEKVLHLLDRIYGPDVMIFSLQSSHSIFNPNTMDFILKADKTGIRLYSTDSKSAKIFSCIKDAYHHIITEYQVTEHP